MAPPDPDNELDDLLDLGIATAFGLSRAKSGDDGAEVSLAAGDVVETLADLPGEVGHYTVVAILAQGGMGTVARGIDRELDREVAIKFLSRSLGNNPEVRALFHSEARAMAQLQHPGIVPVHEIGSTPDERLYYVMTLVDGESLRELLRAEDRDPDRLLPIFARICETIAFAHDREFVHGDLKPANVMLGAFGEVQVLDWGFARSLQSSQPPGGPRIVGTPAYMAPEQARGLSEVDPRTDVFGLGSILCEILTGAPPYRAPTREEVFLRASRAWLDDAHERLGACAADPALIGLARECLSADPDARPADAGAVASVIGDHLAAVERRARNAKAEAAAASVRAIEERKARRMTLLLSVLVASILVAGMGLMLWLEQRDAGLRADAEQRVHAARQRATELRHRAQETDADKPRLWGEAQAVIGEAVRIAQAPHVSATLLADTRDLETAIEREARVELRDGRARALIEEVRPHRGEDRSASEVEAEHRELFALFDVDPDTDAPDTVAAALLESELAPQIAAALHHWAHQRRGRKGEAARWQRLLDLADRIDPDPWRIELRRRCASRDADSLRALSDAPKLADEAGTSLGMLAECLVAAEDTETAVRVYRTAHLHQPGDYGILHDLAALLERQPEPPRAEITRLFTAAVALRPNHPHTLIDLAIALLEQRETEAAEVFAARARSLAPDYPRAWTCQIAVCSQNGDRAGAVAAARELLRLQPRSLKAVLLATHAFTRSGQMDEALTLARDATRRWPSSADSFATLGSVQLEAGFLGDAIATLRRALEFNGDNAEARYDLGLALQRAGFNDAAEAAYREVIEALPNFAQAHCNLSSVLQRQGQFAEAAASLRRGDELGRRSAHWAYPTGTWLEALEKRRSHVAAFEAFAAGGDLPEDTSVQLSLAGIALARGDAQRAWELYQAAYRGGATPGGEYLDAVRAAAGVATAPSENGAGSEERARAAKFARDLLSGVLRSMRGQPELGRAGRRAARATLETWLLTPELDPLRDADAGGPTLLDATERRAWTDLLREIREFRGTLSDA